jgi:hypothetical protein
MGIDKSEGDTDDGDTAVTGLRSHPAKCRTGCRSSAGPAVAQGFLTPSEVPVEIIVRGGNRLIVNTRSSLALTQAGIPEARWNLINRTGVAEVEANITERLARNKLGNEGSEVLRITGSGADASTYRRP